MTDNLVIIAGGGIGGLATALTLHQIGVPCIVFEAARDMRPLGVGINLQPNAVRELYDLGLTEADVCYSVAKLCFAYGLGNALYFPFSVGATTIWEKDPLWQKDPVMMPFRVAARAGQFPGYAGPADRKAAEVLSKYVVTDMYAKALQGMPAEEAVKWAHNEIVSVHT